jgi:hypothetical protein
VGGEDLSLAWLGDGDNDAAVGEPGVGAFRAMPPMSLHFLVNGYICSLCDLDWGIGRSFQQICRDVVEVGAEVAAQRGLEAKQGDLRGLPASEGA